MEQKQRLLTVLKDLAQVDFSSFYYSLTINYIDVVPRFKKHEVNISYITDLISNHKDEITSFNLTIDTYNYSEEKYKSYYFDAVFIFHSGGIVGSFVSNYLSNREIEISNVKDLILIYKSHKKFSKELYNVIKKPNEN